MAFWFQDRFDGGLNERHELAPNSLSVLTNAYVSDDGTITKRGGKSVVQTLDVGAAADTAADSLLHGGETFYLFKDSSAGTVSVVDPLVSDTPMTGLKWYHASWTSLSFAATPMRKSHALIDSNTMLWGDKGLYCWNMTDRVGYSTGTVAGTAGTAVVTGTGTTWSNANAGATQFFIIESSNPQVYRIESVDSTTQITLDRNLDTSPAGANYTIQSIAPVTTPETTLKSSTANNTNMLGVGAFAYHQGRLFFEDEDGNLRWSALPDEVHATDSSAKGISYQELNAYITIKGDIRALVSYGQELLIFTSNSVLALRGDVSTDGADLGAYVAQVHGFAGVPHSDAVTETPLGLVFLHSSGPYLYRDGQAVPFGQDVVDARASGDGASVGVVDATQSPRIVFGSGVGNVMYEYDVKNGTWAKQQFDSTKKLSHPVGAGYSFEHGVGSLVSWEGDRSTSAVADGTSTTQPVMTVTTQPIPMSRSGVKPGRVNKILVAGWGYTDPNYSLLSVSTSGVATSEAWVPGMTGALMRCKPASSSPSTSRSISVATTTLVGSAAVDGIGMEIEEANAV